MKSALPTVPLVPTPVWTITPTDGMFRVPPDAIPEFVEKDYEGVDYGAVGADEALARQSTVLKLIRGFDLIVEGEGTPGPVGPPGPPGPVGPPGAGVATGPVDNAALRADGTGGSTAQGSPVIIADPSLFMQPHVQIKVDHPGQANSSLVLTPKGTGGFIVSPTIDGGAAGGNARGANSIDIQTKRQNATQVAQGANNVCIGNNCRGAGNDGVTIGLGSTSNGGVAIGNVANSSALSAIALGSTASASAPSSLAFGTSSQAVGQYSIAIGFGSFGENTSVVTIGTQSVGSGDYGVAIGDNATVLSIDGVAVGHTATAEQGAVAIGKTASASGVSSVAVGETAQAAGGEAIAIGMGANAMVASALCIGKSYAYGSNSACLGSGNTTVGASAIALGSGCYAGAAGAIALGVNATSNRKGMMSHSNVPGRSISQMTLIRTTVDAIQAEMTINGFAPVYGTIDISNRVIVEPYTILLVDVFVVASSANGTVAAAFNRRAVIRRDGANNTTLVGVASTPTPDFKDAGASGWTVQVLADNAGEALQVMVLGAAGVSINWFARLNITEMSQS